MREVANLLGHKSMDATMVYATKTRLRPPTRMSEKILTQQKSGDRRLLNGQRSLQQLH